MKNKILLFVCALLLSSGAWAQFDYIRDPGELPANAPEAEAAPAPAAATRFHRYYYVFGGGAAFPIGGHWGDRDAGFKPAPAFTFAGAKKVDDALSYGLEASYVPGHKNRSMPEMGVRVFSFTPFLRAAYQGEEKTFYGILGAGIYHWTQPPFMAGGKEFASDSGSSFGVNMGGGVVYPFWDAVQLGLELRWHHIFTMQGENFDVKLANNLVPSVFFAYGF